MGTSQISFRGAQFAVDRSGSGNAVVLAHAGVTDRHLWDGMWESMSRHYDVIRYDNRGFGKTSTTETGPWSLHRDLIGILDAANIEQASIVGVSQGGATAINTALEHPDRVTSIVAVNPALYGLRVTDQDMISQWDAIDVAIDEGRHQTAAELEMQMWLAGPHRDLADMDLDIVERMREMLLVAYGKGDVGEEQAPDPLPVDRLAELKMPVLGVYGSLDVEHSHKAVELLAEEAASATAITMEGVAHLPPFEAPADLLEIVKGFLP